MFMRAAPGYDGAGPHAVRRCRPSRRRPREATLAIRPLVLYPDPRLDLPCPPVERFDAALAALADDLHDTLIEAQGIGITGPHIGEPVRLTVIRLGPDAPVLRLVDPRVTWASDETARATEGSVSMRGQTAEVERPARVRVAYRDLDGELHEIEADGLLAVCLQHEIDQLDGIFWLKRLSRLKRERLVKAWTKSRRAS